MDSPELHGTSVTNYWTRKKTLRIKLKKAQLVGLEKLNEMKRADMDYNKRKEFWKYLMIKSECDRIEAETEQMRANCCKIARVSRKQKKEDEYFQVPFKSNPDVFELGKLDCFVQDNIDLAINGRLRRRRLKFHNSA
ncbi:unnamed protein product [Allacma fusca]|uniref:Uncharacterized protein n=1 Tax=Allacma fusca TaxID=39272 RepID=A0A8J2L6Y1_9HEXA|nr:unnamed protein product [Allacma fusca]